LIINNLQKLFSINYKLSTTLIRFLTVVLILCFCGCYTYKTTVLVPDISPDLVSESGFLTQKADSLNITFAHIKTTPQFWIFSIEIINKSKTPLLVNPDMFYYKIRDNDRKTLSIPHFAHSNAYMLHYAEIELGQVAAKLSYKELTPRLLQNFNATLLKSTVVTDTTELFGYVYFPHTAMATNLLFNFKIDTLDFETPFVTKSKSMIQVQDD
jgi:hypothetical protein